MPDEEYLMSPQLEELMCLMISEGKSLLVVIPPNTDRYLSLSSSAYVRAYKSTLNPLQRISKD